MLIRLALLGNGGSERYARTPSNTQPLCAKEERCSFSDIDGWAARETTMRNHLLILTASAFVLASSGAAYAQQGSGTLTTQEGKSQSGMTGAGNSTDMPPWHRRMGDGTPHGGGMMGHSPMMQMILILADTNGDGKLSLQEFRRRTSESSKRWTPTKMGASRWRRWNLSCMEADNGPPIR